jgi:ubiquitin carboxyl-terminal hydrolase MINDY-1/2
MDLNPLFTMSTSFRPGGAGGELKLFEQVGISLVHGWLVDPESPEGKTMENIQDYDSAVSLIAEVDHFTHGRFVIDEDVPDTLTPTSPTTIWTESEKAKIEDGQY